MVHVVEGQMNERSRENSVEECPEGEEIEKGVQGKKGGRGDIA